MAATDRPATYEWVASANDLAGYCFTISVGLSKSHVMQCFRASSVGYESVDAWRTSGGRGAVAGFVELCRQTDTVLVVEPASCQGMRSDVLQTLSKRGRAGSLHWDGLGLVLLGCARRGKIDDLADLHGSLDHLPLQLRKLLTPKPLDLAPAGAAALADFIGVPFYEANVSSASPLFELEPIVHELDNLHPMLGVLRNIAPEIVSVVLSLDSGQQREFAIWCSAKVIQRAPIRDDLRLFLVKVLPDGTGGDRARLHELTERAQAIEQETLKAERLDLGLQSPAGGPPGGEVRLLWSALTAVDSVRYSHATDATTAAIGSLHCMLAGKAARADDEFVELVGELQAKFGLPDRSVRPRTNLN